MYKFNIPSLRCKSCFHNIEDALKEIYPEASITVDMSNKIVFVDSKGSKEELTQLIENAGYPIAEILE